jgi:hypothetical protein
MAVLLPPFQTLQAGEDTGVTIEVQGRLYAGNMPQAGFEFQGFGTLSPQGNVDMADDTYSVCAVGSGKPVLATLSVHNALPPERGNPIMASMGTQQANVIFHVPDDTYLMPGDYEVVAVP